MPIKHRVSVLGLISAGLLVCSACQSTNTVEYLKPLTINIKSEQLLNHFKVLSSDTFQGRKVSTTGNKKAQQYLIDQLSTLSVQGFKGQYKHSFHYGSSTYPKSGNNIIAFIPGSNEANKYIVLTAHFDHLGTKGNRIFNGADDNASGTSALLAMAEQLVNQPLSHHIIVLFTDGEENGLKGSKAFIHDNQELLKNIKLNINMDMLAGSKRSKNLHFIARGLTKILTDNQLTMFYQNQQTRELSVVKGFKRERHSLNKRTHWLLASDHGSFHQAGIPFIYYGVGTHSNYHSPSDEYLNTNHQLLINSTNIIFQQLLFLDQAI